MIQDQSVLLFKPMNFMNNSGFSVAQVVNFYKIKLSNTIVIYDDLDLDVGKIKIKTGGGSGGHNGINSIDNAIGKNYVRLRIGIGHPKDKNKVTDYVLKNFPIEQRAIIDAMLECIVDNLSMVLDNNFSDFIGVCSRKRKKYLALQETKLEDNK